MITHPKTCYVCDFEFKPGDRIVFYREAIVLQRGLMEQSPAKVRKARHKECDFGY